MTTEPQSPLSESEKLAATLAALEAERQRRVEAGKLGARPILQVLPQTGETLEAAQQREVYRYLADHPDGAKCIAGYDWVEFVLVDPKPTVELPGELFGQPDAVDVSPPPSPPKSRPARSLPPALGAGALSGDPRNYNVPRDVSTAERRRTQRFMDDEWGNPQDHPLRYPRGRGGW